MKAVFLDYIQESMREKGLQPAGIVAAELVNACKPHPEIFEKALEGVRVIRSLAEF